MISPNAVNLLLKIVHISFKLYFMFKACSRNVADINQVLGTDTFSTKRTKCLTDGNFNPIQCVSDKCICVHSSDGSPVNPKQLPININLISELPCCKFYFYKYQFIYWFGFNITDDPILHNNGSYLNNCEKKYLAIDKKIESLIEDGFDGSIGIEFPFCQLDGKYSSVQETKTE